MNRVVSAIGKFRIVLGIVACSLAAGCGTSLSGQLDGQSYVSRTGDIRCTFPRITADHTFRDYSSQDGEWVSNNLGGTDIQRVERVVLKQGAVPAFQDVEAFVDNVLPRYMALSERIKGSRLVVGTRVQVGNREGIYTLVEFKTYTPDSDPPESLDYRGILWLLGEKYGTSLHVFNWRYTEKDADKIEARLMGFYNSCSLKG
jgi:hypothetical protein